MVIADDPVEASTDKDLLGRARDGQADAFCRLIQPLQTRLFRQAMALSGDSHAAEDLVSETLVEAWKSLSRYNNTCRLSTWLYAILLHRHQKAVRRARSRPIALAWLPFFEANRFQEQQENLPSSEPSPSATVAQNESLVQMRRCVAALPTKHRQVVLLRFFEDASLSDIATALGCSVGTVKSRLHHALDKLRTMKMNLPEMKRDKQL